MSAVNNWNEFVSGTDTNDELDQDTVREAIDLAVDALAEMETEIGKLSRSLETMSKDRSVLLKLAEQADEAKIAMYHERGDKEQAEAELDALEATIERQREDLATVDVRLGDERLKNRRMEAALAERDRMLKRYVKAGDRMVKGINAYFGSSAGQEVDQMNDARIGWQQLRARAKEGGGDGA